MDFETIVYYPSTLEKDTYTNVLLIDNMVSDYHTMVTSVNSTTFPIVYSYLTTKEDLIGLLNKCFITINRIGLCFVSNGPIIQLFLDNQTMNANLNTKFLINIIQTFKIVNMDF